MTIKLKPRTLVLCILFAISLLTLASCADYGNIKYRTWIDFPQQGNQFYLGDAVPITAHYFAKEGADNVVIRINDLAVVDMPVDPYDKTTKINHEWTPGQTGKFTIGLMIQDQEGQLLSSTQVEIYVLEEPEITEGIFLQNGFCRLGPGTAYPALAVFEGGYQITLEARSESLSPLWWYVYDQSSELFCWVSQIVIETDVAPESLLAMEAPPIPEPEAEEDNGSGSRACHSDLNVTQCIASGGTWFTPVKINAPPYCQCP